MPRIQPSAESGAKSKKIKAKWKRTGTCRIGATNSGYWSLYRSRVRQNKKARRSLIGLIMDRARNFQINGALWRVYVQRGRQLITRELDFECKQKYPRETKLAKLTGGRAFSTPPMNASGGFSTSSRFFFAVIITFIRGQKYLFFVERSIVELLSWPTLVNQAETLKNVYCKKCRKSQLSIKLKNN